MQRYIHLAPCLVEIWNESTNKRNIMAWFKYHIRKNPEMMDVLGPCMKNKTIKPGLNPTVIMTEEGIQKLISYFPLRFKRNASCELKAILERNIVLSFCEPIHAQKHTFEIQSTFPLTEEEDDEPFVVGFTMPFYMRMLLLEDSWKTEELSDLCQANEARIQTFGYCYAAWNPLFNELIKIGATMRTPHIRLKELSGAGTPEPFELISSIRCSNPFKLERSIHRHFATKRKYGMKKEFFLVTKDEIAAYFAHVERHISP